MSTKIDPEDPRLTAYVLGELEGDERRAFEELLANDPSAKQELEQVRRATKIITAELAHEPALELKPEQRDALKNRLKPKALPPPAASWRPGLGTFAMLGVLGFVVGVPFLALHTGTKQSMGRGDWVAPAGAPVQAYRDQYAMVKSRPVAAPPVIQNGHLASLPHQPAKQQPHVIGLVDARSVETSRPSDGYERTPENDFKTAAGDPLSTFSIDVDTASYAMVRRFIEQNTRPPVDAVRIEELVNYFPYSYPEPDSGEPLTVLAETTACPWKPEHRLVRIGVKGKSLAQRPASNLVFLLDVSGSMNGPDRLPLLIQSLKLLVDTMSENDTISIVVYAGASGLVLPPTSGTDKPKILASLESLHAGGSTNGGAGIELAYQTAISKFIKGGNNRVILATDGDFNVGVTSRGDLERLIEEKRQSGVFLSILGFGMGNHQDATLERLSSKGNGNYAYIDSLAEARKVLVEQAGGTLVTVAKDVKVQVEFNPAQVASYRLVGYENRMMAAQDFNDDKKDAGELGAGHTVTALYEVVPATAATPPKASVDPLKYQQVQTSASTELLTVKVRHQPATGGASKLLSFPVTDRGTTFDAASVDTRFAASVAAFGMLLRNSPHRGAMTFDGVLQIASKALGEDKGAYRAGFVELVKKARDIVR